MKIIQLIIFTLISNAICITELHSKQTDFASLYANYIPKKILENKNQRVAFNSIIFEISKFNPDLIFTYIKYINTGDSKLFKYFNYTSALSIKKKNQWIDGEIERLKKQVPYSNQQLAAISFLDDLKYQSRSLPPPCSKSDHLRNNKNRIDFFNYIVFTQNIDQTYSDSIDYNKLCIEHFKQQLLTFSELRINLEQLPKEYITKKLSVIDQYAFLFNNTYYNRYNITMPMPIADYIYLIYQDPRFYAYSGIRSTISSAVISPMYQTQSYVIIGIERTELTTKKTHFQYPIDGPSWISVKKNIHQTTYHPYIYHLGLQYALNNKLSSFSFINAFIGFTQFKDVSNQSHLEPIEEVKLLYYPGPIKVSRKYYSNGYTMKTNFFNCNFHTPLIFFKQSYIGLGGGMHIYKTKFSHKFKYSEEKYDPATGELSETSSTKIDHKTFFNHNSWPSFIIYLQPSKYFAINLESNGYQFIKAGIFITPYRFWAVNVATSVYFDD